MARCVPLLVQGSWFEALEKNVGLKLQGLLNKGEIFQVSTTWLGITYFSEQSRSMPPKMIASDKEWSVGKISILFQYTYATLSHNFIPSFISSKPNT